MKDFLLGWHEQFSPLGPALRSPTIVIDHKALELDAFRFGSHEVSKRAVAPSVAPSVRPVAELPFTVGQRVRVKGYGAPGGWPYGDGDEGTVVGYDGDTYVRVQMDGKRMVTCWGTSDAYRYWDNLELIPAQREQVASPSVRQPDSKGESKGTTASDGEWKTQPPTEPGWYVIEVSGIPAHRKYFEAGDPILAWFDAAGFHGYCASKFGYKSQLGNKAMPPDKSSTYRWLRKATPAEIGE